MGTTAYLTLTFFTGAAWLGWVALTWTPMTMFSYQSRSSFFCGTASMAKPSVALSWMSMVSPAWRVPKTLSWRFLAVSLLGNFWRAGGRGGAGRPAGCGPG